MVEGAAEVLIELFWGAVEGALDWLGDRGDDHTARQELPFRYPDTLYEQRPPQDPNA